MKYKDWLDVWLESVVKPTAKTRTYERYSELISSHITPTLGDRELSGLTPIALQEYVADLLYGGNLTTGKGLSSNTVNTVITILQNSLKSAYSFRKLNECKQLKWTVNKTVKAAKYSM